MKKIKLWNHNYDKIVGWNKSEGKVFSYITFPKLYTRAEADAFKAGYELGHISGKGSNNE